MNSHDQYDTIVDHPPQRLSERALARLDNLFEQIAEEANERARRRCMDLLRAHLGADGMAKFLKTSHAELGHVTGAEMLDADPCVLLNEIATFWEGGNAE